MSPFRLALLALALVVSGCDSAESPRSAGTAAVLDGTSWVVISAAGRAAPVPRGPAVRPPTLAFAADRVTGFGGCNAFGGSYRYDPGSGQFEVGDLASTLIGCLDDSVGLFESVYVMGLTAAARAAIDPNGSLHLDGPGGEIVLGPIGPAVTD